MKTNSRSCRLLAVVISLCMLFTSMGQLAFAADETGPAEAAVQNETQLDPEINWGGVLIP